MQTKSVRSKSERQRAILQTVRCTPYKFAVMAPSSDTMRWLELQPAHIGTDTDSFALTPAILLDWGVGDVIFLILNPLKLENFR